MTAFTNAGRNLIAQKQGAGQPLALDRFVLANIAGLDHSAAVDQNEVLPQPGDIVWQGAVSASGYVNPDQVVYSLLLGSTLGDFSFNWVGLLADDDTLVAVSYVPTQLKTATSGTATGNNLTRNFLLAFTDAQDTTNITVQAGTWQIDFNARLDGIDDRERLANLELYGRQRFFNDGLLVEESAGSYSIKAGSGFVGGLRVELANDLALADPGVLPKDVWLDVALTGDLTGKAISITAVISSSAQVDTTDGVNINHYLEKIGTIEANGTVTDLRSQIDVAAALVDELLAKASQASQSEVDTGTNDTKFVTPKTLENRLQSVGFESGTVLVFPQAAAPTGWTKSIAHNNKALRIVSGNGGGAGGSVDFTAAFKNQSVAGSVANTAAGGSVTVNNHTLTESQIPSHKHITGMQADSAKQYYGLSSVNPSLNELMFNGEEGSERLPYTSSTGGGGSHNHSASFSGNAHGHTFNGTAINMAVKYVDSIIAVKD
ncbi:MAG: phage tail protein [Motiliproteus sp.]